MLSYEKQLELKRDVVVKAYQHYSGTSRLSLSPFTHSPFSNLYLTLLTISTLLLPFITDLPTTSIPPIEFTVGSPLQYGYRTKITPHFDAPPKKLQKNVEGRPEGRPGWLNIGFNKIGKRTVLDIEVGYLSLSKAREPIVE